MASFATYLAQALFLGAAFSMLSSLPPWRLIIPRRADVVLLWNTLRSRLPGGKRA